MASPLSEPDSPMSRKNYGVFLSFRGPDSRNTIVAHLYRALCQRGVYTFKDNEELEAGQRRSELFEAIGGSRIAVVVFSENYATSKWCLDELAKIIYRKNRGKIAVIPIFYKVSPQEVRLNKKENGEEGCYQKAIKVMEGKTWVNSQMLQCWRTALWEGGDMIGPSLRQGGDEDNLVQQVVDRVSKTLDRVPLEVAMYPVDMIARLKAVKPSLHMDPHEDAVYMIGIHGSRGVGKTTLSKAVCNHIANGFDDWCFLPDVRSNDLAVLQQTLLCELLKQKDLTVPSIDTGKILIKERLCNKRVVIILDDVDEMKQLDALAGNLNWFGKGSRIIITTTNRHLLPSDRVRPSDIYTVELLGKDQAEELFRWHASCGRPENLNIDHQYIEALLNYANRLPLALTVLGSLVRDRSSSDWKSILEKLDENPDKTINSVLKISFKELDPQQKEIFLDIACFFNRWDRNYVVPVVESCYSGALMDINVLVERCLITVENGQIQMHELIEVMGRSIVRDEYSIGDGVPSRIWLYEDFLDVFSEDEVVGIHVKGIVLNLARKENKTINKSTFKGLKRLRLLVIRNAFDTDGPLRLPSDLRWFDWPQYSELNIELSSTRKLVGLHLPRSNINQINLQDCKELKFLNIGHCRSLVSVPDLSQNSKLIHLDLQYCNLKETKFLIDLNCDATLKNLILSGNDFTSVDECITKFENLDELQMCFCEQLTTVRELPNILRLLLIGCRELQTLPSLHAAVRPSPRRFYVDLSNSYKMITSYFRSPYLPAIPSYIETSFPLPRIREFGGAADVIVAGEEFLAWMNFQTEEGELPYRASLPEGMSENDILGLALYVTFDVTSSEARSDSGGYIANIVTAVLGHKRVWRLDTISRWESVHTWFVYLPRQQLSEEDTDFSADMDWSNITFRFTGIGTRIQRCGCHVVCKREQDDQKFRFHRADYPGYGGYSYANYFY
ncbi:hypothetical protein MLD38_006284 [Melastoma candidum]|uniref:Uncharacterized protein n=1 Tax=Melastoma candidum TaxID=119954 RepID=A0ACB9RM12_9MYRT|nr:hypothetical protein MLD38_006284 [Melastoma candidum]